MFYFDENDIKKVATESAQLRDRAVNKDPAVILDVKNFAYYKLREYDTDAGEKLEKAAETLYKDFYKSGADRNAIFSKLVDDIQEYCGRAFRTMITYFRSNTKPKISDYEYGAGLGKYFSNQKFGTVLLDYETMEKQLGHELPSEAYDKGKAEIFWRSSGEFQRNWTDYAYQVNAVYFFSKKVSFIKKFI